MGKLQKGLAVVLFVVVAFASGVWASPAITLIVNGRRASAEVRIINGVSFLPLRAVADLLEVPVHWNGSTRTITVGTAAPPGGAPSPIAEEGVYRVRNLVFSDVQVKLNVLEMWDVSAQLRNNDTRDYSVITFTAAFFDSTGRRIGTANGTVLDIKRGETKTVQMLTTDNLSGFTRITFQVDAAF